MIDILKHIDYWRDGAQEDWEVAGELIDSGRTRHGLFFAHLALEKMLKAHICRTTNELAPKIHNLVRLVELADLKVSRSQRAFLGRFNQYQLEGRYPDTLTSSIATDRAKTEFKEAETMLKWLINQF